MLIREDRDGIAVIRSRLTLARLIPGVALLAILTTLVHPFDAAAQSLRAAVRMTPSVVWCDDFSTVRFEVTIRNRTDVAHVEFGTMSAGGRLYDDGTHGDAAAGDYVFTGDGARVFCSSTSVDAADGVTVFALSARLILKDGSRIENAIEGKLGAVSRSLKDVFQVSQIADGLFMTRHALFIHDRGREIFPSYPLAHVEDRESKIAAARKLYSVLPDVFDFLVLTPGLTMYDPDTLSERSPHMYVVGNQIKHIAIPVDDGSRAAMWSSAGRLKSAIWDSFGEIEVFDHEVAHTWGAGVGIPHGFSDGEHWEALTDIAGQLSNYYRAPGGKSGLFFDNGDGTWRFRTNTDGNRPYAPLELYAMGLVAASDVPPVHLLISPDLSNPDRVTAQSVRTMTIQDILRTEGGAREPGPAESQKQFNVAYVVAGDEPFTDAHFAFSSQLSRLLMSREPPRGIRGRTFAPFFVATGGRATLSSDLVAAAGTLCDYRRSPGTATFTAQGGFGATGVQGAAHCAWTAVTAPDSRDWITVLRPSGKSQGAGNVVYVVKANASPKSRQGTLIIAGQPLVITQAGAGSAPSARR